MCRTVLFVHRKRLARGKGKVVPVLNEGIWVRGYEDPHFLDLGTSWRGMVSFTLRPLYLRGKIGCWVDPRAGLDGVEKTVDPTGTRNPTP
jgi:hypothetical protein